jgi:hypothetical protein
MIECKGYSKLTLKATALINGAVIRLIIRIEPKK